MSAPFSCEKYIQYHRQPFSTFKTMAEFNREHHTMMFDPQVESAVKAQHSYKEEYQDFELERTDLMTYAERREYFKSFDKNM